MTTHGQTWELEDGADSENIKMYSLPYSITCFYVGHTALHHSNNYLFRGGEYIISKEGSYLSSVPSNSN